MFYLIEIATGNEKIAGKAVYGYATQNEAVANFHGKLSAAMKSELFETELVMVIDDGGKVLKREKYVKPVQPTPEPEIEEPIETPDNE